MPPPFRPCERARSRARRPRFSIPPFTPWKTLISKARSFEIQLEVDVCFKKLFTSFYYDGQTRKARFSKPLV